MKKNYRYLVVALVVGLLQISCGGPGDPHTSVLSAFFIGNGQVGILLSKYRGGEGVPGMGSEHPSDFSQHYLTYDIASGTMVKNMAVDSKQYFFGSGLIVSDSFFTLDGDQYQPDRITLYSFSGSVLASFPPPSATGYTHIAAITPNGRFLLFNNGYGDSSVMYDRNAGTYGPPTFARVPNGQRFENDLKVIGVPDFSILPFDCRGDIACDSMRSWIRTHRGILQRYALNGTPIDILDTLPQVVKMYPNVQGALVVADTTNKYGYIVMDTTAARQSQFISIDVLTTNTLTALDTVSGYYLITRYEEVVLGNYKTGVATKQIYP